MGRGNVCFGTFASSGFPLKRSPHAKHPVTIILLRMLHIHGSCPVYSLCFENGSENAARGFYDFGRKTIGVSARPSEPDDFRLIPNGHCDLDSSTRLRASTQIGLGRFRTARVRIPPAIPMAIA
jgi:hypothetical protein